MGESDIIQSEVNEKSRRCLIFLPANARLNFDIWEHDAPKTQYNDRRTDYGRDNVATIVRGIYGRDSEQQLEHIASHSTGL